MWKPAPTNSTDCFSSGVCVTKCDLTWVSLSLDSQSNIRSGGQIRPGKNANLAICTSLEEVDKSFGLYILFSFQTFPTDKDLTHSHSYYIKVINWLNYIKVFIFFYNYRTFFSVILHISFLQFNLKGLCWLISFNCYCRISLSSR